MMMLMMMVVHVYALGVKVCRPPGAESHPRRTRSSDATADAGDREGRRCRKLRSSG